MNCFRVKGVIVNPFHIFNFFSGLLLKLLVIWVILDDVISMFTTIPFHLKVQEKISRINLNLGKKHLNILPGPTSSLTSRSAQTRWSSPSNCVPWGNPHFPEVSCCTNTTYKWKWWILERAVHNIALFYLISLVEYDCSTFHRFVFVSVEIRHKSVKSTFSPLLINGTSWE